MSRSPRSVGRGRSAALRRRDRHGRGLRGPLLPSALPAWRSPAQRFDDLVLDSIERLAVGFRAEISKIEFAVEDVPPADPSPWEHGDVPLSRCFPADRGLPTRIVVYRRPIEARSDRAERAELVHGLVVEQVAHALGVSVSDLDPRLED